MCPQVAHELSFFQFEILRRAKKRKVKPQYRYRQTPYILNWSRREGVDNILAFNVLRDNDTYHDVKI